MGDALSPSSIASIVPRFPDISINKKYVSKPIVSHHREGDKVWCPDPRHIWQLGTVVCEDDNLIYVLTPEDNEEHGFHLDQVHPYDPTHGLDIDDISTMDNLHEAPLLDLLRRRYSKEKIYTFTGDILVSINPYKTIPSLYIFPEIDEISKQEFPSPHVYVTADRAYRSLVKDNTCQSILISGESGAGKTEASKYIMRYLANISSTRKNGPSNVHDNGSSVEQCVLQSNPLLEAFGNAKTIRNDNSSRFGKFIKIHYDNQGFISGASTNHFLLEKSRIVASAEGERNYHIFYQMCAGLDEQSKEMNDKKDFAQVVRAMKVLGVNEEMQSTLWLLLASILHLGNIEFTDNAKNEAVSTSKEVELLSNLLGIKQEDLRFSLCKRTMQAGYRGSVAEIALTVNEAQDSRNGLAKAIYSAIFDWLVDQINRATCRLTGSNTPTTSTDGAHFIGILDIFGFEILKTNSFEQLCINFANEMLQQQFNHHVFVYEQEVYVKEGIDWTVLEFKDNQSCLDLIQQKPLGVLPLLDEQAMLGRRASDVKFLQKLHQTHLEKHPHYDKPRFDDDQFIIKHYAGDVTYNILGFLDKNNDSLHNDLLTLTHKSTCTFLKSLFPIPEDELSSSLSSNPGTKNVPRRPNAIVRGGPRRMSHKMTGTMTVGRKFREQMTDLMLQLNATFPSYVRCVKPNNIRFAGGWNGELIMAQLVYLGVIETVRIRRSGFPVRRTFQEFYSTYEVLIRSDVIHRKKHHADQQNFTSEEASELIVRRCLERKDWQIGHKKIFLRDGQLRLLDSRVKLLRRNAVVVIQKNIRMCLQRLRYRHTLGLLIRLQAWIRMSLARQQYKTLRMNVIQLEALCRGFVVRKRYKKHLASAITIQALLRGHLARKLAKYLRCAPKAATTMNSLAKMFIHRKRYKLMLRSATRIASQERCRQARWRFLKSRNGSCSIAAIMKGRFQRQRYLFQKVAAVKIHAVGRGFVARLKYGRKARERAVQCNKAQIVMSRLIRGFLARCHFIRIRRYVVMIQARYRANKVRTVYLKGRDATIHSQALIRRALARRKFLHERKMATRLESFGRMIIAKRHFAHCKFQLIKIQSLVRMYLVHHQYRNILKKVVMVQSWYRALKEQEKYRETLDAIVCLQSLVRRKRQRQRYLVLLQSSNLITSTWRGYLKRKLYQQTLKRICILQSMCRMRTQRKKYLVSLKRIVQIQSLQRGILAKKIKTLWIQARNRLMQAILSWLYRRRLFHQMVVLHSAIHQGNLLLLHAFKDNHLFLVRDRKNKMSSILHMACKNEDLNMVRYLLEDRHLTELIMSTDLSGNTPLHYACDVGHLQLVQYLGRIANVLLTKQSKVDSQHHHQQPNTTTKHNNQTQQQQQQQQEKHSVDEMMKNSETSEYVSRPSTVKRSLHAVRRPSLATPVIKCRIHKQGYLKKASGVKWATKRYVVVDDTTLTYFKQPKDKLPLKIIYLKDAYLKRNSQIEFCFEIHSVRLCSRKNPEGMLLFSAESEQEVQDWMSKLRSIKLVIESPVTAVLTEKFIYHDLKIISSLVNVINRAKETPLHRAVQNTNEGLDAVKIVVWLIEAGAAPNCGDQEDRTPLHLAVDLEREDLVETLLKKKASIHALNAKGQSPLDLARHSDMRKLLLNEEIPKSASIATLLNSPVPVPHSSYLSAYFSSLGIFGSATMENPFLRISVLDIRRNLIDCIQDTPVALIQDRMQLWWGNTWYMQTPMEHICDGAVVVFELHRKDYQTNSNSVLCWTFVRLDLNRLNLGDNTLEMYSPPVDPFTQSLQRIPGDSFFQLHMNLNS